MKILQLVTKRQFRGAEVFAANLSNELILLGHQVLFVGLYGHSNDTLTVSGAVNEDLVKKKNSALSLQVIIELKKFIKKHKPDIVQCNGSDTLKYMYVVSFLCPKIPIIYRNISMISEWISPGIKTFLYRLIFRRIDHVSSVGNEALEDFIKTLRYPRGKTSVVKRGIPIKEVNPGENGLKLREEIGVSQQTKIAVHVGNFSPEKNHIFLLDVFEEISKTCPKVKLVCVGTGINFDEVQKKIMEKNIQSTIFLLGFRKDIPEILSSCDLFVLSSRVEGVPGVILEAGAQKKPAVSTNVGGVQEVLINGETGFLINDFSKREFVEKVILLMKNDDLRRSMGEKAFNLVYNHYNPKTNAVKFEELYHELV